MFFPELQTENTECPSGSLGMMINGVSLLPLLWFSDSHMLLGETTYRDLLTPPVCPPAFLFLSLIFQAFSFWASWAALLAKHLRTLPLSHKVNDPMYYSQSHKSEGFFSLSFRTIFPLLPWMWMKCSHYFIFSWHPYIELTYPLTKLRPFPSVSHRKFYRKMWSEGRALEWLQ